MLSPKRLELLAGNLVIDFNEFSNQYLEYKAGHITPSEFSSIFERFRSKWLRKGVHLNV